MQNWVLEEIKKMREAMEAMGTTVKDYHWARASVPDSLLTSLRTNDFHRARALVLYLLTS